MFIRRSVSIDHVSFSVVKVYVNLQNLITVKPFLGCIT